MPGTLEYQRNVFNYCLILIAAKTCKKGEGRKVILPLCHNNFFSDRNIYSSK